MTQSEAIPWKRITVEAVAIVASILLAFSIDAWWDDRQARVQEKLILESLHAEFHEIGDFVRDQEIFTRAILDSANQLLDMAAGKKEPDDEQEIDRLIEDLWWNNSQSRWRLATLESIIATGELSQISNPDLRRVLTGWHFRLEGIRSTVKNEIDFYNGRLMPFLTTNAEITQIINAVDHAPGHPDRPYVLAVDLPVAKPMNHSELLENREFRNMVAGRASLLFDTLGLAIEGVSEDLDDTIELIENELQEL